MPVNGLGWALRDTVGTQGGNDDSYVSYVVAGVHQASPTWPLSIKSHCFSFSTVFFSWEGVQAATERSRFLCLYTFVHIHVFVGIWMSERICIQFICKYSWCQSKWSIIEIWWTFKLEKSGLNFLIWLVFIVCLTYIILTSYLSLTRVKWPFKF